MRRILDEEPHVRTVKTDYNANYEQGMKNMFVKSSINIGAENLLREIL